jgi:small-conductance mechanosensitive channel
MMIQSGLRAVFLLLRTSIIILILSASAALSQSPPSPDAAATVTAPPSPNDVRELMRLLGDPSIRNWLAESASSQSEIGAVNATSFAMRDQLAVVTQSVHERLGELATFWTDIPKAIGMLAGVWQSQLSQTELLRLLTYCLIFLFIGAALEWLYHQYTKYRSMQIEFLQPSSFRVKYQGVFARLGIELGSLSFFVLGSIGAFLLFDWPETMRALVLDFLIMIVAIRFIKLISRVLFAPRLSNLRLVNFTGKQAALSSYWFVLLLSFGVFANFVHRLFSQTLTVMSDSQTAGTLVSIDIFVTIIWALLGLSAIWSLKRHFSNSDTQRVTIKGRLADTWPTYLTVLLCMVLALSIMGASPLTGTVLTIGLLVPAISLAGKWVESLFNQAALFDRNQQLLVLDSDQADTSDEIETTDDVEAVEAETFIQPVEIYGSIIRRVVRFLLVALAILLLINLWDINLFALSASQSLAGKVFDVAIDTLFALLLADLIWHWAKSAIDRRLADYTPPPDGQAPGPEARMATLLPMLRMILMVTLLMVVFLSILTSFGVNVAPLLAGAGVLGVAIGFGAQALVRDVVSGIFFLIDDAFRIGEYIEIDNLRGTVESMSIRSLRVRHHRGMVHTIPFGELKSLTNYSRDWVIMKLEFRVPFETDLKLVKKLVKKIGAELLENEVYGKSIIQTLKSQGVRRMEEFNMVVGVKFMTKPGEQWLIRRDAYQKVRDAFDANGIGFAERNVKVQVMADQPMSEETRKAVVGAAQDAVEQQLPPVPIADEP